MEKFGFAYGHVGLTFLLERTGIQGKESNRISDINTKVSGKES